MQDIDRALESLDLEVFAPIESQTSDDDKRSLLACQAATRRLLGDYRYLEIGSHLGGSIQPHLLDSACTAITSIDNRPPFQPDERGVDFVYTDNSTARMLDNLATIHPDLTKLHTIDADTADIEPSSIHTPVQLCFIDGEHTDDAASRDFTFCLEVLDQSGVIVLHDASVIYNGLRRCLDELRARNVAFHAYVLPEQVFVVEIGEFPIHRDPLIVPLLLDNHVAYLHGLGANDHYRRFSTRKEFQAARRLRTRVVSSAGRVSALRRR